MANREETISSDHEEDDAKIFPQRLMEILDDETNHEAISWLPHGKAFVVRKRDLFASMVMPKYFSRKAKYSSFTRKLNRWNFTRVGSGPELGAYYHEFFLRDKPQLAAQMFCKNARTMLAMASVGASATHVTNMTNTATKSSTTASTSPSPAISTIPVTPALLAALSKEPSVHNNSNNNKTIGQYSSYAPTNLRLLEFHLQQQEEANRILLQHAISLSQQQRQQQQEKIANQHARLVQMQQLMQLRQQQQNQSNANNHRASAA